MFDDPSTLIKIWVAVAFFGFFAMLFYFKVHVMVGKALDARADAIRKELDEARKLREEAQALLADYKRKHEQAEEEAEAIITLAKREAEVLASETRKTLAESLERRTRLAEEKIERAEAQAVGEVRNAAIDASVAAAERIVKARLTPEAQSGVVERSIKELTGKLN